MKRHSLLFLNGKTRIRLCQLLVVFLLTFHIGMQSFANDPPNLRWTNRSIDGSPNMAATDRNGIIYEATSSAPTSAGTDILIRKFDPDGHLIGSATYHQPGSFDNIPTKLLVDPDGNIYLMGMASNWPFVLKFNSDLVLEWDTTFKSVILYYSIIGVDMMLDPDRGSIVVVGKSNYYYYCSSSPGVCMAPATDVLMFILKLSMASGSIQHYAGYNPSIYADYPVDFTIDHNGNIYVIGVTERRLSAPVLSDMTIWKITPNHVLEWIKHYNTGTAGGGAPTPDKGINIDVDEFGYVYAMGGNGETTNLIKYAPDSREIWIETRNNVTSGRLEVHNAQNIYVAYQYPYGQTITLAKFDSNHTPLWENNYDAPFKASADLLDLKLDQQGNAYIGMRLASRITPHKWYRVLSVMPDQTLLWDLEGTDYFEMGGFHIDSHLALIVYGQTRAIPLENFVRRYQYIPIVPGLEGQLDGFHFSIRGYERLWCWNEIDVDPICLYPRTCPDPPFAASAQLNDKITWEQYFKGSLHAKLPESKDFQTIRLRQVISDKEQRNLIVLNNNLISNGIKSLEIKVLPDELTTSLYAETFDDSKVPFTMTLLNKEGTAIWQHEFTAPLKEDIKETVKEQGATLVFSAIEQAAFKFYPNPFSEKVTVSLDGNIKFPATITVYSLQGNKLTSINAKEKGEYSVNLANQKPGLYILELVSGNDQQRELIERK